MRNKIVFRCFLLIVFVGGVCFLVLCGMENTIFLAKFWKNEKLDERKNPVPFTLSVRSFNMQNKIGGKIIRYENATLMQPPKKISPSRLKIDRPFKNPNHWINRTRNIKTPAGIKKYISYLSTSSMACG